MSKKTMRTRVKGFYKKFYKFFSRLRAFTLLELIVVITILAILTTIAYLSIGSFIRDTRDVSRFENLNRIDFAIELFVTEKGYYPQPDEPVDITFSGAKLWTQGVFGDKMRRIVGKINKKPVDVVSLSEFTYSLANDGKSYELGSILEGSSIMFNDFGSEEAYAARKLIPVRSMVVGNYNGIALTTNTGGVLYILAIPTILSYDITETDIVELMDKQTLAFRGFGNIAASYTGSIYQIDGGFEFDPSILVIYSGTYADLINNESNWINVLNNVQIAYSGTILEDDENLKDILDVEIDIDNPSKDVREIAYDLIIDDLDIDVPVIVTVGEHWITYEYLYDSDTRSITQDSALSMWFATKNGVFTSSGGTWSNYTESDGLINKEVRTVLEADDGRLWFATNKGLSVFDGNIWVDYTELDGLIDDDVVDILQDSYGKFWFATKKGISEFDLDNDTWTDHEQKDGLGNKVVTGIDEDRYRNIWASTINGVSKYTGNYTGSDIWETFRESSGLSDKNVLSLDADGNGNIWFGTINGISKMVISSEEFTNYNIPELIGKYVNDIIVDSRGSIWVATTTGASRFDGSDWFSYTIADGLADNDVQIVFEDDAGNIWFGTKKGITIYYYSEDIPAY